MRTATAPRSLFNMKEHKVTKASEVSISEKPVVLTVSGSLVVRCNRCGQLLSDVFKLSGGTVKCPYCKSQYIYQVELKAKQKGNFTIEETR